MKASKSLVKTIQKVINKDVETKESYHSQALIPQSPDIQFNTDMIRILPNIVAGVDSNQRIGSKLRAQTLLVKGHLLMSTTNTTNLAYTRIAVRLMIVQPKFSSFFDTVNSAAFGNPYLGTLLQKGSTSVPFQGTIADLYAPIDKDSSIVLYDKIHYMSVPLIMSSVGQNDLRQSVKFFTFRKKLNKVLKYVDALSATQPQNCSPIMLVGYTTLEGSPPNLALTQISVAYDATLTYEDA